MSRPPKLLILVFAALALSGCLPQFQLTLPFQPMPTALARGEKLYNENCLVCHKGAEGGTMMDYPPRHNANGHTWHHPDCELTYIIVYGSNAMTEMMRQMMNVPTTTPRMPAWRDKLSREEIDAILAFIRTMWTEEQRGAHARVTQAQC